MKICMNCNAENHETADQCIHCNMVGNFSEPGTQHDALSNRPKVHCQNCGSEDPGPGTSCIHCRFPLPAKGAPQNGLSKLSVKSNWRTG